jgi:hypothetical protein
MAVCEILKIKFSSLPYHQGMSPKAQSEEPPDLFTLTVDREQAKLISAALELHSRLQTGQFDYMAEALREAFKMRGADANVQRTALGYSLKLLAADLYLQGDLLFDVTDRAIPDSARVAYDLLQVIEHTLAMAALPPGAPIPKSRWVYDSPRQTSHAKVPLATMEKTEKDRGTILVSTV